MSRRPPKPLSIKELQQIKALVASGKTYHAVAMQIGRDPKTVKKACMKPQMSVEIQEMKQELADMFENLARRMIDSITETDIGKINAHQRTVAAAISTDKMRLLRDQSTENIGLNAVLQGIEDDREKLLKELEDIRRNK